MRTSIQGQPAEWSDSIMSLFISKFDSSVSLDSVTDANYFRPRPYKDEYNTGSDTEGFVYTLNGRHVTLCEWRSDNVYQKTS